MALEMNPDDRLLQAIQQAFSWHFWLPRTRIHVAVNEGWVTLSGTVEWLFQKTGAERAVSRVSGVRGITNNIVVSLTEDEPSHRQASLR